jgi:uncharacterized membrane-anchored protein
LLGAGLAALILAAPLAIADGGPALKRGALERGEVVATRPPPKAPAPVPKAAPAKAAPVTPTPAPPPAALVTPPPVKADLPKVEVPAAVPTAPDGARAGMISLDEGVTLNVPQGWAFWPAAEAQTYLRRIQAPTPQGRVLGIIAPAERRPTDAEFWGAVVTFTGIGRVSETRAERFTAMDFLDEARGARPANGPRLAGFPIAPAYDPGRKVVTWAERIDGAPGDRPLRLEHRLLGRRGVAGLTTAAKTDQQPLLAAASSILSNMLGFSPGNGAADAVSTDPAAMFDLPGVITNRPIGQTPAVTTANAPAVSGLKTTPLAGAESNASGGAPSPATGAAAPAAAAGDGLAGMLDGWFQWVALGILVLAALPWIIFRRSEDDIDENLQPR